MSFENYFGKSIKRTVQEDYNFGTANEDTLLPLLRKRFDPTIKKATDKYCRYDYISDSEAVYELKTRRNSSFKYDTTMLPYSKLGKEEKEQYFIFAFTDSIKYIKYDFAKFKKYEVKEMSRKDRGKTETNKYVLIPVCDLSDL
jgi:hypothetical protein